MVSCTSHESGKRREVLFLACPLVQSDGIAATPPVVLAIAGFDTTSVWEFFANYRPRSAFETSTPRFSEILTPSVLGDF
jgi:hypothetical protein